MRDADAAILLADDPRAGREAAALAAEHGWTIAAEGEARWRVCRG
jgi:tRNA 2-thiouridine synthesizing protein A